jgi:O-antigen/teichoic acid export membrane protein
MLLPLEIAMIARKSLLIMTSNFTEGLLAYVALFFIARYMGPESYGIIGFAMGFIGLFTVLLDLGFNAAHIKRVSEGKDPGLCIGTYTITKLMLSVVMVATVLGAILFWKLVLGRGFESPAHETALYIILGYYVINGIATMFNTTYRAMKEIAKSEIPLILGAGMRTIAIIFVALSGFGPIALAYTYVFGEIIFLISSVLLFRGYPIKKPTRECFKNYAVFAFPIILVGISTTIISNADKVIIQLFWSSTEVGYYFACYRITQFLLVTASSLGILLLPTISSYHMNNDIISINKTVLLSERYISMLVFPMVIGMVVLAEPIVRILLSSSFYPAYPILMILPFFVLLEALSIPFTYQVVGMNKPKLAGYRILIMVCITIALNIILVPKDIKLLGVTLFGLGAVGASIATVIGYIAGFIYCRIVSWRLTKYQWNLKILLHLLAATIMGIILYKLNEIVSIDRWFILLGFVGLGLAIYLGVLILVREFTRDDYHFLLDVLSIKKMWNYITKEMKKEK